MDVSAILSRLAGFLARKPAPAPLAPQQPLETGTVFERVDARLKRLQADALERARPLAVEIRDQISKLRPAVTELAKAEPDAENRYHKVGLDHQRGFTERMARIQAKLDALFFAEPFEAFETDRAALAQALDEINQAVLHNRHMYVFYAPKLQSFNAVMKRLLELNAQLSAALFPARQFTAQVDALHRRQSGQADLSAQIQDVERQKVQWLEKAAALDAERSALEVRVDSAQIQGLQSQLETARLEENKARDWFYSFLEKLEGPLKQYAHGKEPGVWASTAERYLAVKEDFLKDCLLDSEDLRPLLDALFRKKGDTTIDDFLAQKDAMADAFEDARLKRQDLERELRDLQAPLERAKIVCRSGEDARLAADKLRLKALALDRQKAALEQACHAEAEGLLSSFVQPSLP